MQNTGLLSVTAVSDRLGLSRSAVTAMIKRGDLPGLKLGRVYRIHPSAVESIEERAKTAVKPSL